MGSDFGLFLFDTRNGKRLRTFWGHTGTIWAVAPSPDNRYLLSASSDQTLRIWDPDKNWPLLTLFVAGSDWIGWTPEGYYAASPGDERLMGWHLNNGPDQLASFYPAVQFRKSLYRPDLIRLLLEAGTVAKALGQADKGNGKKSEYVRASQVLPPRVAITAPAATPARVSQAQIQVRAKAVSVGEFPVTSLRLLVNGRPYQGQAGLKRLARPQFGEVEMSWNVELSPGINRLCVQAASSVSSAVSEEVVLDYGAAGQRPANNDLYMLAIGINNYPGASKLDFAAAAAEAMTKLLQRQEGAGLYRQIHTRLLTDRGARRQDVMQGLRWLRDNVRPIDVVMVFYAGHGIRDPEGRFYLLPADMNFRDLPHSAISEDEPKEGLAELPGRVLLLLDACHAGKVSEFDLPVPKKRGLRSATDDFVRELSADE